MQFKSLTNPPFKHTILHDVIFGVVVNADVTVVVVIVAVDVDVIEIVFVVDGALVVDVV